MDPSGTVVDEFRCGGNPGWEKNNLSTQERERTGKRKAEKEKVGPAGPAKVTH